MSWPTKKTKSNVDQSEERGFTLVELIAVIAVIGILTLITALTLQTSRQKFRDAKRIADVRQIQTALEFYYADQSSYPAAPQSAFGTSALVSLCSNGGFKAACAPTDTVYIIHMPEDPGSNKYTYTQATGGTGYAISFSLESGVGTLKKGPHIADPNGIQ